MSYYTPNQKTIGLKKIENAGRDPFRGIGGRRKIRKNQSIPPDGIMSISRWDWYGNERCQNYSAASHISNGVFIIPCTVMQQSILLSDHGS
jgi:hypothetical protein